MQTPLLLLRSALFTMTVFILTCPSLSGQWMLENTRGQEMFLLYGQPGGIGLPINSRDQSITLQWLYRIDNRSQQIPAFSGSGSASDVDPIASFAALEVKGRATNGISTLFEDRRPNEGIEISFSLAFDSVFSSKARFIASVSRRWERYSLYRPAETFDRQIDTREFKGTSFLANYRTHLTSNWFAGAQLGYKHENNYHTLPLRKVTSSTSVQDSSTQLMRTTSNEQTLRMGDYLEYDSFPFSFYLGRTPTHDPNTPTQVGFAVYYGSIIARERTYQHNLGASLFLLKNNKNGVQYSIGSIYMEVRDIGDSEGTNKEPLQKTTIGLLLNLINLFNL